MTLRAVLIAMGWMCVMTSYFGAIHAQPHEMTATFHADMLRVINAERAKHNLPPYCINRKLQAAAQEHVEAMATNNFMSDDGMSRRIKRADFDERSFTEAIAGGQDTIDYVMYCWMDSSKFRERILSKRYKFMGAGFVFRASAKYGYYWTVVFASSSEEQCDMDSNATPVPARERPTPRPIRRNRDSSDD